MKFDYTQIVIAITGIISTITAWKLGGKQQAKTNENNSLTEGTESLIGSLKKLVEIMQENLNKEVERTQIEREHRDRCEKSLAEHKQMIDQLRRELNQLKRKVK